MLRCGLAAFIFASLTFVSAHARAASLSAADQRSVEGYKAFIDICTAKFGQPDGMADAARRLGFKPASQRMIASLPPLKGSLWLRGTKNPVISAILGVGGRQCVVSIPEPNLMALGMGLSVLQSQLLNNKELAVSKAPESASTLLAFRVETPEMPLNAARLVKLRATESPPGNRMAIIEMVAVAPLPHASPNADASSSETP